MTETKEVGRKHYCAVCGKLVIVFADQEEYVASLPPEEVLHEICSIERHGAIPDFWHCPRCDAPIIVQASRIERDEQSPWIPDVLWGAETTCPLCGYHEKDFGKNGTVAAKVLYHSMRCEARIE